MRLVIDSNRLLAGLIKDSTSRKIILDEQLMFYSPDYLLTEINKYKSYLVKKTRKTEEQIDIVLYSLLENITLVPYCEFENEMKHAVRIMEDIDIKDAPFLAVGMAINANGIWTEDKHFNKQDLLKPYSTKDMIDLIQKK